MRLNSEKQLRLCLQIAADELANGNEELAHTITILAFRTFTIDRNFHFREQYVVESLAASRVDKLNKSGNSKSLMDQTLHGLTAIYVDRLKAECGLTIPDAVELVAKQTNGNLKSRQVKELRSNIRRGRASGLTQEIYHTFVRKLDRCTKTEFEMSARQKELLDAIKIFWSAHPNKA